MDIAEKIARIEKLYEELEKKIVSFKEKTGINCVYGCGNCCNHFEPYTSVLETTVIAKYLRQNETKLQEFWKAPRNKTKILCPFYDDKTGYHCTIYTIRPMICRLYAFSGKRMNNSILYSPCPEIKEHYSKELILATELLRQQSTVIPIYREEYPKLYDIDFVLATDLHPITRCVEIALEHAEDIASEVYQKQEMQKQIQEGNAIPFTSWVRSLLNPPICQAKSKAL